MQYYKAKEFPEMLSLLDLIPHETCIFNLILLSFLYQILAMHSSDPSDELQY